MTVGTNRTLMLLRTKIVSTVISGSLKNKTDIRRPRVDHHVISTKMKDKGEPIEDMTEFPRGSASQRFRISKEAFGDCLASICM